MAGTLFTYPNNFRAQKALIAAQYSGVEVNVGQFVAGQTDKSDEFLSKFPLGKVPAFSDGKVVLNEANAIAYYVGNEATRGGANEAEVLNWVGFADNVLEPAACTWVYPTLGMVQYNKQNTEKAKEDVKKALGVMNQHLQTRTYLVGERVSQADISVACTMVMLYQHVMEDSFRAPFVNVNRWFTTLVNQAQFKQVLGEVKMCTKMAQFDSKKYNEIFGKGKKEAPKKNEKKGKSQAAGDSKPKILTAAEREAQAPPAPKKTDPWAESGPATMDMDEWKRCYSNEKDNSVMLKYFHEKFPKETYSIWRGKYMYNDELTLDFLANNLIRGMLQRLEKLRKHAFGCICLVKNAQGKFEIEGLWAWRGDKLAFTLCDDWKIDYETYAWEKLDYNQDSTKELINAYWIGDGKIEGKEIYKHNVYK